MNPEDIELIQTCWACPEQYDAIMNGETVGYLRLRFGNFTVECPDVGGDFVYDEEVEGEGMFEDDERDDCLLSAKQAIAEYHNRKALEAK